MPKRKSKVSLIDFAGKAEIEIYDGGRQKATYFDYKRSNGWGVGLVEPKTNIELETYVIDQIANWTDYRNSAEFSLLESFVKLGHGFEGVDYFYSKIESIKNYHHGDGAQLIYNYCRRVLKGRLPSGVEDLYLSGLWNKYRGSSAVYKYAKYVIRGRLSKAAEVGCNSLDYVSFLSSKGVDFEDILMGNTLLSFHFYRSNYWLPENVHNFMMASYLSGNNYARTYFKQRKKDDVLLLGRLKSVEGTKTIKEFIESLR